MKGSSISMIKKAGDSIRATLRLDTKAEKYKITLEHNVTSPFILFTEKIESYHMITDRRKQLL